MTRRWFALAIALALFVAACGGGKKVTSSTTAPAGTTAPGGSTETTTKDVCAGATLEASEIGVTPDKITVTVSADSDNPIRPGLFKGSIDGAQAWAKYQNETLGGLACRQVEVVVRDSKLSADEAKAALTAACTDSLAMVGTTALFLNDMTPAEGCKDKAGAVTGLPDLAVLQTEPVQQCSPVSFAMLPNSSGCPYSGTGERSFKVGSTQFDYYLKKFPEPGALHGVWMIPSDLPSTISASMPGFRVSQQLGIKLDAEFGASGLATQSAYTQYVQAIKDNKSTYARNGLDYKGTVYLRKEAAAQGVDTVKVWDCSTQCYDSRLLSEGGAAVEDQYVWLNLLPFEDKGHNENLDAFLANMQTPDGFGEQAFMAGLAFSQAVKDVVAKDGPNGLTRAALLAAIRNIHKFDAGGLAGPIDLGGKTGSICLVAMQVKGGKFVRLDPKEPGKFNCSGKVVDITLDPVKEFRG